MTCPPFASIVIAGLGSVGGAFVKLAGNYLSSFPSVFLVDLEGASRWGQGDPFDYRMVRGDVRDEKLLDRLLKEAPAPVLFLNVCSGIDTLRLRRSLSGRVAAYLDVGASALPPEIPASFHNVMTYTSTPLPGPGLHLLCQGLNPGMVELVARRLMGDFFDDKGPFEIVVFERDTLSADLRDGAVPVGWSPSDLLEEMILLPPFEIREGARWEATGNGAAPLFGTWEDRRIQARIVAHEDIWNLGLLKRTKSARFYYSLSDKAMDLFAEGHPGAANRLLVPPREVPLHGRDTIIVTVREIATGRSQSRAWSIDHSQTWQQYGLNGVQYQTATSLLLSVLLVSRGGIAPTAGTYNSTTLPLTPASWDLFDSLLDELAIAWLPVEEKDLPFFEERA